MEFFILIPVCFLLYILTLIFSASPESINGLIKKVKIKKSIEAETKPDTLEYIENEILNDLVEKEFKYLSENPCTVRSTSCDPEKVFFEKITHYRYMKNETRLEFIEDRVQKGIDYPLSYNGRNYKLDLSELSSDNWSYLAKELMLRLEKKIHKAEHHKEAIMQASKDYNHHQKELTSYQKALEELRDIRVPEKDPEELWEKEFTQISKEKDGFKDKS